MDEKKRRKGESESERANKTRNDTFFVRRLKVEPHSSTEPRTSNSKTHKQTTHGQYGTTEPVNKYLQNSNTTQIIVKYVNIA